MELRFQVAYTLIVLIDTQRNKNADNTMGVSTDNP